MFKRRAYLNLMRFPSPLFTILIGFVLTSCERKSTTHKTEESDSETIESFPLSSGSPSKDDTLFTLVSPSESGVEFTHKLDLSHPLKRLYHGGFATGGIAIGDLDGDDLPDLFFASGPGKNRLFRNLGNLRFEPVDHDLLSGREAWGTGVAMGDIDNDGDLDLYVCNYQSPNQLFINEGNLQFSEQATDYGLDYSDGSLMPSFCDYDNDGDLDCFVLTYRLYRENGWPQESRYEIIQGTPYIKVQYSDYYRVAQSGEDNGKPKMSVVYAGRYDRLYRNDGNKSFSNISEESGIIARGHGLSATWWDANDDGLMDLYVGNDFQDSDHFYLNQGDGTFKDVIRESVPHTTWFSMGADSADLNNDGLPDFLTADMSSRTHFDQKISMGAMGSSSWFLQNADPRQYMRNALYLNTGTPRFKEGAYLAGLADTDWTWAVKLADFNNDGWNDAFFTNGTARHFTDSDKRTGSLKGRTQWDAYEDGPKRKEQNLAFRNQGGLRFADVSKEWGLNHTGVSYSAATGDLDGDGDLDLVVANLDEPVSLYRNNSSSPGTIIQLQGSSSNRFGFGAKVSIETPAGIQMKHLAPASGFLSSNEPIIHFGTDSRSIDKLTIQWPGGNEQEFTNLESGKRHLIKESSQEISSPREMTPIFEEHHPSSFTHKEIPFDDYAKQPLLANKLSQLGPGMASSGELIWFGGARGQAGEVWSEGKLLHRFEKEKNCEDMGGVFFDIDADGDDDLYVVSGGVEADPGHEDLRDRLYLNQGDGKSFQKTRLPDLRDSGGPVAAADFDRDGDLDLFVGGRVVPGAYPSIPQSRLLRNDDASLTDQTDSLAPGLRESGMVTSAVWSDIDNDGWIDLLATYEWGPIKIWKNSNGILNDATQECGTSDLLGWWNSITPGDFDQDGDMDYVVGNVGLNTKYEVPSYLYYGDFDGSGKNRIVEAEVENDIVYPVRGRSCSSAAIPMIKDKFKSYREFAAAPLQDIYSLNSLQQARQLEANTLTSGWLRNDNGKTLTFIAFEDPVAQIAPVYSSIAHDFNGDGHLDLFLAQNSYAPQPETGRMAGGLSCLLLGNGGGEFTAMRSDQSGLSLPVDAKSAILSIKGLVIGVNDGPTRHYRPTTSTSNHLYLRLIGPPGNPHAYGARITIHLNPDNSPAQVREITAGQGYLSQSLEPIALGAADHIKSLQIRWPNGEESSAEEFPKQGLFEMRYPE